MPRSLYGGKMSGPLSGKLSFPMSSKLALREGAGVIAFVWSLIFSDARNSQYVPLTFEEF